MRSYIDNRGVYHRFIDWAKLFGRKKDTEEKVEEASEIQESVDTTQYAEVEDKGTTGPAFDDDCCDDCDGPFDGSYEYLSLDKDEDVCLCEDEWDEEDDFTELDPSVVLQNTCQAEEMPADNSEQLVNNMNTNKSEKVVKEKSAAKKTAKKTTAKSSKSKK